MSLWNGLQIGVHTWKNRLKSRRLFWKFSLLYNMFFLRLMYRNKWNKISQHTFNAICYCWIGDQDFTCLTMTWCWTLILILMWGMQVFNQNFFTKYKIHHFYFHEGTRAFIIKSIFLLSITLFCSRYQFVTWYCKFREVPWKFSSCLEHTAYIPFKFV